MCLQSRSLATAVSSGSKTLALSEYATIILIHLTSYMIETEQVDIAVLPSARDRDVLGSYPGRATDSPE
jgi:hypothetical protein